MKNLVLIFLATLSFAAAAAPSPLTETQIQSVVGHCRCVMSADVCVMETQPQLVTRPQVLSTGVVQPADANYLVLAGPAMCDAAERELRANSVSPRSLYARSRWRQDWSWRPDRMPGPCPYSVR